MAGPPIDPRLEEAIQTQDQEEKERARVAEEKRVRRAYVNTFESADGRIVLKDLRAHFYDVSTYVPGDPYGTHVGEGGREVVLRILTLLKEEHEGVKEPQKDAET